MKREFFCENIILLWEEGSNRSNIFFSWKKYLFRELDQEKQDEKSLLLWEEEFHEE